MCQKRKNRYCYKVQVIDLETGKIKFIVFHPLKEVVDSVAQTVLVSEGQHWAKVSEVKR